MCSSDLPRLSHRRLLYVGITRARRTLTLLHAGQRRKFGKPQLRVPSRFIEELPVELVLRSDGAVRPAPTPAEEQATANSFFSGIKALLGE